MAELNDVDTNIQDVKYLKNQLNIARNEINNLRYVNLIITRFQIQLILNCSQQLVSLSHSHRKDCEDIRNKLENWRCPECRNRSELYNVASGSNAVSYDLPLRYIGMIHTHFPEKRGTPRQPGICTNLIAKLTLNNVFSNPEHALEGLQEYSHMWYIISIFAVLYFAIIYFKDTLSFS